jgi:hypothetical protein
MLGDIDRMLGESHEGGGKIKLAVFVDKETGYIFSDRRFRNQFLCKKHKSPVTKGPAYGLLCEIGKHTIIPEMDYEVYEIERLPSTEDQALDEWRRTKKPGESRKYVNEDGVEIEEF